MIKDYIEALVYMSTMLVILIMLGLVDTIGRPPKGGWKE